MHPGEIKGNTGYRKEVAEAGIDKFVLDMSGNNSTSYQGEYGTGSRFNKYVGNIRDRYVKYLAELVGKPNVTLLSMPFSRISSTLPSSATENGRISRFRCFPSPLSPFAPVKLLLSPIQPARSSSYEIEVREGPVQTKK